MRLNAIRTMWGVMKGADGPWPLAEAVPKIRSLGYTGIEAALSIVMGHGGIDNFGALLRDNNLQNIAMVFTDGPVTPYGQGFTSHPKPGKSVDEHLEVFKAQVIEAQKLKPLFVNSHSGNDYWSMAQAEEFFGRALEWQEQEGFEVYHETHRKRFLHSPWVTRDFLPKFPNLKLVADLSHWVCVAETDTADEELNKVIKQIAPQVYHIHARVGYDHGPQVADPRAAEWMPYTVGHEAWWQEIWKQQAARGQAVTTLTPEHGPPNYQQTVPGTGEPLADIWEVNHFIAKRQACHFDRMFGSDALEPEMRGWVADAE